MDLNIALEESGMKYLWGTLFILSLLFLFIGVNYWLNNG